MLNNSIDQESNGDISINTNIKVFKGGLGLVNKKQPKKEKKIVNKEKILEKEKALEQNTENANEILSFRSAGRDQFTLSNDKVLENKIINSNLLKKHICEKLNQKPVSQNVNEKEIIKKIFKKETDEKELKIFEIKSDRYRNSSSDLTSEEEVESQKVEITNLNEDEKNIFWNLKNNIYNEAESSESHRKRCKSVSAAKLNTNSTNNSFHNSTSSKVVSKVSGTFSMLDRGKAVFVSNDDYIFILPALFIPQNLVVGNTYMFKICEIEKLNNRVQNINENIQKKYLKFTN
jgi:hypothetical protein